MEFLAAEWMGKPFWMWKGFLLIIVLLLAFDLGVLNREDKEMGVAASLNLSAFYIAFAMLYGAGICWAYENREITTSDGVHAGLAYFIGFFIEKALSIDNVFVISLIFGYFAIPRRDQCRALVRGHYRRHCAARHHDRSRRGAGAAMQLGAVSVRHLPNRDWHQDAGGAGRRAGYLQKPRCPLHEQAYARDG